MCKRMLLWICLSFILNHTVTAQQKELGVAASSPRGKTSSIDQSRTIQATFSRPMAALQAVPADEGTGPFIIEPKVKGKYRWMGTITSVFLPEKNLPYSTKFTVKIPAGTSSLKGTKLSKDFIWTFETPRPNITWTSPENNAAHVDTITAVLLRFNQPVDPQVVAKNISIQLKKKDGSVSFPIYAARRPLESDSIKNPEQVVIIKTKESFGMGAYVSVKVNEGVCGAEGPLPMDSPYSISFSTYGELKFLGIREPDNIYPQTGITLLFSNAVTAQNVLKRLSFAPPMKTREEYYEITYPMEEIFIPLPLLPESTYTGIVTAGLADKFGNTMKGDGKFSFTVKPYPPFVRTRTGIGILEGYESHKFPVTTMNVDSFRVQMGEVNPECIVPLMQKLSWDYYERLAVDEGLLLAPSSLKEEAKEFTRSKVVPTRAKRNTVTVRPLNFDDVLGKDGRGIIFVQVDDMNEENTAYLKTLVQVTNFGITAKFSPESNLIWVTNLKDASPVADASVEIRNDSNIVAWTGRTDEKGVVKTPGWGKLNFAKPRSSGYDNEEGEYYESYSHPRQWVIVKKGKEIAFTSSEWNEGIQPYRFDISYDWNPQPEKIEGVLFTDRGLYKANETVDIKGIVRLRAESAWKLNSALKTRLVIKNSRNEEVYNKTQKLSPFGSFVAALSLKPNAPLGYYSMQLQYRVMRAGKERWKPIEYGSFRVEAFRPAEFDVTAKFDKESYIMGDTVNGFLNAKYLFGAPMKNENIKWRLAASRGYFTPKGFDEYFFDRLGWLTRYEYDFYGRQLENKDTLLDSFGSTAIRSHLKAGELQGTVSLTLEGDVTSPSRQTLSGRASVIVHGGEYYIGIRPSSTFVKSDSAMNLTFIAASPEGKIIPDRSLTVMIYQRVWRSVRKAETGGRYSWYSTPSDSLIDSSCVVTINEPLIKSFIPKSPGFYYVDVSGNDTRGNNLLSQTYFYASGSGYVAWERTNDDRIDLIAKKKDLKPGETASIIVKNPYEKATALISIEREGILKHYTTMLAGSAPQIDIPITGEFLPNVFVSVVLLQGRTDKPTAKEEADVGRPSFKVGYIALSVNPVEKKLNVNVESNQKEYRPGDTVDVKITVKDIDGKPKRAEVALSVADLGILNLINYRLPNPFESFYRERGLAVTTTETRMHIIEQRTYDEKGQEVGGGGAKDAMADIPDADGIRKNFRSSAYWNPSIMTDKNGSAVVRFKLPDNLTAFEMMAVAQTKESYFGYGENSFKVNKPLLLQPSLPRFARAGDSFKSGVVIMNYSDKEQAIKLITNVTGLQWDHQDTTLHSLQPGQAKEVLFSFIADRIGTAKFVFRARSEKEHDGLQWTIPVNAPRLKESVALYESLVDSSIEEHIIPPAGAFSDIGEIEVTAASTAMVGLSGGISYLFHYPYGCLEQRASSVLPMILAKDLVEAFKFEVLKNKDYRAVAEKIIDEIPLFQQSSGGFSYWKNEGRPWNYISAYAMYTLVQAQRNGYQIDKHAFEKGIEYLKRFLRGEERDMYCTSKYYVQCTSALTLYTLALAGKQEYGYMEKLYNERGDMPLFPKAYLLKALHTAGGNQSMQDELVRDLSNRVKIAPTSAHYEEQPDYNLWWCFDSNTRTTALIMQALVETQPENPIIPKVVRWLTDQKKAGCWRTTQENIYVVDALATYMRAYEKDEPNFRTAVMLEGKTLLNEYFKGRSFKVVQSSASFKQLTMGKNYPVKFTKDGIGRLYYGMRMSYYPKGETQQKDEGFSVVKTIEPLKEKSTGTYTAGSLMKVTLTVSSNQDRHFVVVDDPVPAGFEVVNTSFETTASQLGREEGEDSDSWYEYAFHHVEKYDDRVQLFADYFTAGSHSYTYFVQVARSGKFQMPATRTEGMYEPEVFGQTASKVVEIK